MAIRVIEKAQPDKEKKADCENCGASLGYFPKDVSEVHSRDISGGPDGCKYIVCPECNTKVILESW